jgi:hypothetical protein
MSSRFTRDPKIQALGDEHGPGGPLMIAVLLGEAKVQGSGGRVEVTFRDLAHDTFIDSTDARNAVETAARLGVLEIEQQDERHVVARFPKWRGWQEAFRKQRTREGADGGSESAEGGSPSASGEKRPPTEQDRTTTNSVPIEVPPSLTPLVETLNRVVEGKSARPLKIRAALKACSDFADRNLGVESDKFRHYWLDGAGENRRLRDVAGAWRNWLRSAPRAGGRSGTDARVSELVERGRRAAA